MQNNTKKVIWVVIILLILVVSYLGLVKSKESKLESNPPLPKEEVVSKGAELKGSGIYSFDVASSKIAWQGKKTLIKEWVDTGSITMQSGNITLLDNKITQGKVVIDMNSITAEKTGQGKGEDSLSKHLKSADFFDAATFPTSQFSITSLTPSEKDSEYIAKGDLTIKNITKPIEFPVIISMVDGSILITGEVVINRAQFDIKFGSTSFFKDIGDKAIDDNFILKLDLVASKS